MKSATVNINKCGVANGGSLWRIPIDGGPGDSTQLWYVAYANGVVSNITKDLATYNVGLGVSDDARSFLLVRLQQINHISVTAQRISEKAFSWPSVSPDGKWIACASVQNPVKDHLAIIPIEGGEPVKLFETAPLGNLRLGIRWANDGKSIVYRDQRVGLWRQAVEGGAPTHVQGVPAEKIYGFGWSRDNKFFLHVGRRDSRRSPDQHGQCLA